MTAPQTQAHPHTPTANPALLRLAAFVGEWEVEASIGGQLLGRGRVVFEWLQGGAFLVQYSTMEQVEFPTATTIIGPDDSTQTYCMLYYDSRAVSRVYQMSLNNGVWKLWREAPRFSQRFEATFSDDGRTIRGRWGEIDRWFAMGTRLRSDL
ncbi:MAG: hypothetical protein KatS3mg057_1377 [Herpetosiphonaceae bacterium]|nr:MAG: hypothetical protein KatS3mg057_1377 [Herpetosiphonaceae bacterium]